MRGRARRLEAAALVDRNVHDDGAGFHQLEIIALNQHRSPRSADQHGAHHEITTPELFQDAVAVAEQRCHIVRHDVV
jgi:hypothetical protein